MCLGLVPYCNKSRKIIQFIRISDVRIRIRIRISRLFELDSDSDSDLKKASSDLGSRKIEWNRIRIRIQIRTFACQSELYLKIFYYSLCWNLSKGIDKKYVDWVSCFSWSQTKQFFLMQFLHFGCLMITHSKCLLRDGGLCPGIHCKIAKIDLYSISNTYCMAQILYQCTNWVQIWIWIDNNSLNLLHDSSNYSNLDRELFF